MSDAVGAQDGAESEEEMGIRLLVAVVLCTCLVCSSDAVVIDSFNVGPLSEGPPTDLDLVQTGLDTSQVIGGERDWSVLYEGTLDVAGPAGSWRFSQQQGSFEVAILRYGTSSTGSSAQPLNADLTTGGNTQLTIRMNPNGVPGNAGELPLDIHVLVFSGVGTEDQVGVSMSFRPVVSDEAYVVQMPFSGFKGQLGSVDFSDVDAVNVSVFAWNSASFEMDDIRATAGLPGDYNLDGTVNLADYVVWRDSLGSTLPLPNENPTAATPGTVDQEDYLFWKNQFGATFPSVSSLGAPARVPEPSSLVATVVLAVVSIAYSRRRRFAR